ncbi:MAG TPA: sugar ABC transporter permease [Firmicutes bacterium]|jgi:putative aldouronate transport system permease protein|nr:sugar ABC transporter permease [Bacillota bacterium]
MRQVKKGERLFQISLYLFMIFMGLITLYPFLNVLAISLNDSLDTIKGGVHLLPRVFTWNNYREVFTYPNLVTGFNISFLRTAVGTGLGLLSTAMVAYVISCREFVARRLVTALFILTMYVSGGLIPEFMLVRKLGLMNNFWVYILPGLISGWNVFVLRAYIDTLPVSLMESAKLDGASELTIFLRIVLPLCKPILATIALFIAVAQWNSWFDTYIYCSGKQALTTLQYEMMRILQDVTSATTSSMYGINEYNAPRTSPESIQAAITIVVTIPILLVYPFLQKYFVKGLTLGAIKS